MKRLINKLVGWLNAIAKDKYQHFAVGAVIASAALIVAVPLGAWWRWLPLIVSMIAVLTAAVVKERKIDPKADMQTFYGRSQEEVWCGWQSWLLLFLDKYTPSYYNYK